MPTSSFFRNIEISDPDKAERFISAMEKASEGTMYQSTEKCIFCNKKRTDEEIEYYNYSCEACESRDFESEQSEKESENCMFNAFKTVAIVNSAMWISVSAAIVYALSLTERISVLWFFLIPAFSGMSTKLSEKKERESND